MIEHRTMGRRSFNLTASSQDKLEQEVRALDDIQPSELKSATSRNIQPGECPGYCRDQGVTDGLMARLILHKAHQDVSLVSTLSGSMLLTPAQPF